MMTRKRRKKIIGLAKGYWGTKKSHYKVANEQVMKSLKYAYLGRRLKKRDFRKLWITRISAACKMNDINYSRFMNGLKRADINLNRKMLAEIAVADAAVTREDAADMLYAALCWLEDTTEEPSIFEKLFG